MMLCHHCHNTDSQPQRHYHFLTASNVDALRAHMQGNGCPKDSTESICDWYLDTRSLYSRCVDATGQPLNVADAWMMAQIGCDVRPGSEKQSNPRHPIRRELEIATDSPLMF